MDPPTNDEINDIYLKEHNVLALNSAIDDIPFTPVPGQIFTFNKEKYNSFVETTKKNNPHFFPEKIPSSPQNPTPTQLPHVNPFSIANSSSVLNTTQHAIVYPLNNRIYPKYFPIIIPTSKTAAKHAPHTSPAGTKPDGLSGKQSTDSSHQMMQYNMDSFNYYNSVKVQDYDKLVSDSVNLIQQFEPDYNPKLSNFRPKAQISSIHLQHTFSPPQRLVLETLQREYTEMYNYKLLNERPNANPQTGTDHNINEIKNAQIKNNDLDHSDIPNYNELLTKANQISVNDYMIYPRFDQHSRRLTFFQKFGKTFASKEIKNITKNEHDENVIDVTTKLNSYLKKPCTKHLQSSIGAYFETPFVNPILISDNGGWNRFTANQYNFYNGIDVENEQQHNLQTSEQTFEHSQNFPDGLVIDIIYPNINKDFHNIVSTAMYTPQESGSIGGNNNNNPDNLNNNNNNNNNNPDNMNHYDLAQYNLHQYWFNQPNSLTTLHLITELNQHDRFNNNNSTRNKINTPPHQPQHYQGLLHTNEINTIALPIVPCRTFFPSLDAPPEFNSQINQQNEIINNDKSTHHNLTTKPQIIPINLIPNSLLSMRGKIYSNLIPTPFIQPYYSEQLQGYAAYGQSNSMPFLPIPMDLNTPNEKSTNFFQRLFSNFKFVMRLQEGTLRHQISTHIQDNHTCDQYKIYQAEKSIQQYYIDMEKKDQNGPQKSKNIFSNFISINNSNGLNSDKVRLTDLKYTLIPVDYDHFLQYEPKPLPFTNFKDYFHSNEISKYPPNTHRNNDSNNSNGRSFDERDNNQLHYPFDHDYLAQQFAYQISSVGKDIVDVCGYGSDIIPNPAVINNPLKNELLDSIFGSKDTKKTTKKTWIENISTIMSQYPFLSKTWSDDVQVIQSAPISNSPLIEQKIVLPQYSMKRFDAPLPYWYPYSSYIYTYCDTNPVLPLHDKDAIDQLYAISVSRAFDFDTLTVDVQKSIHQTPLDTRGIIELQKIWKDKNNNFEKKRGKFWKKYEHNGYTNINDPNGKQQTGNNDNEEDFSIVDAAGRVARAMFGL
jgi:hypothetical protein